MAFNAHSLRDDQGAAVYVQRNPQFDARVEELRLMQQAGMYSIHNRPVPGSEDAENIEAARNRILNESRWTMDGVPTREANQRSRERLAADEIVEMNERTRSRFAGDLEHGLPVWTGMGWYEDDENLLFYVPTEQTNVDDSTSYQNRVLGTPPSPGSSAYLGSREEQEHTETNTTDAMTQSPIVSASEQEDFLESAAEGSYDAGRSNIPSGTDVGTSDESQFNFEYGLSRLEMRDEYAPIGVRGTNIRRPRNAPSYENLGGIMSSERVARHTMYHQTLHDTGERRDDIYPPNFQDCYRGPDFHTAVPRGYVGEVSGGAHQGETPAAWNQRLHEHELLRDSVFSQFRPTAFAAQPVEIAQCPGIAAWHRYNDVNTHDRTRRHLPTVNPWNLHEGV